MRAQKPTTAHQIIMVVVLWGASCLVASAWIFAYAA